MEGRLSRRDVKNDTASSAASFSLPADDSVPAMELVVGVSAGERMFAAVWPVMEEDSRKFMIVAVILGLLAS